MENKRTKAIQAAKGGGKSEAESRLNRIYAGSSGEVGKHPEKKERKLIGLHVMAGRMKRSEAGKHIRNTYKKGSEEAE